MYKIDIFNSNPHEYSNKVYNITDYNKRETISINVEPKTPVWKLMCYINACSLCFMWHLKENTISKSFLVKV